MKSDVEVFLAYAAAFEVAYATDEWTKVRECFADDAVYEVEGGPPFARQEDGGIRLHAEARTPASPLRPLLIR